MNGGFTYQVILIEINDIVGTTISGDKAANTLIGDKNANTISGYLGDDIIFGHGGDDTIDGNEGNDVLYGGAGADTLAGSDGNDVLYGGAGADTIDGGAGDDVFYGGAGADSLTGGGGRDHFVLDLDASSPADANTITDFNAGDDTFRIIERTGKLEQIARTGFLDVATAEAQYGITFRAHKKSIFKIVGKDDADTTNRETDDIKLITSTNTLPSSIKFTVAINGGTEADDLIYGARYGDVLQGFGGDDTIHGRAGANILHGGAGSDTIYGGTDSDIIFGGYDGVVETDRLYGAAGNDLIINANSDYDIQGGAGDDTIISGSGARLEGGGLDGGAGADTIIIGSGGNTGIGTHAQGGTGDDLIIDTGLATADQIFSGGAGQDTFALNINSKITTTITDFAVAQDTIFLEVSQAQKSAFDALSDNADKLKALGLRLVVDATGANIMRGDTAIIKLPNAQGLDINRNIKLRTQGEDIGERIAIAKEDVFDEGFAREGLIVNSDGTDAADIIINEAGDRTIRAGAGDDFIAVYADRVDVYGGAGNDVFFLDHEKLGTDIFSNSMNIQDYRNDANEQDIIRVKVTAAQKADIDARTSIVEKFKVLRISVTGISDIWLDDNNTEENYVYIPGVGE